MGYPPTPAVAGERVREATFVKQFEKTCWVTVVSCFKLFSVHPKATSGFGEGDGMQQHRSKTSVRPAPGRLDMHNPGQLRNVCSWSASMVRKHIVPWKDRAVASGYVNFSSNISDLFRKQQWLYMFVGRTCLQNITVQGGKLDGQHTHNDTMRPRLRMAWTALQAPVTTQAGSTLPTFGSTSSTMLWTMLQIWAGDRRTQAPNWRLKVPFLQEVPAAPENKTKFIAAWCRTDVLSKLSCRCHDQSNNQSNHETNFIEWYVSSDFCLSNPRRRNPHGLLVF